MSSLPWSSEIRYLTEGTTCYHWNDVICTSVLCPICNGFRPSTAIPRKAPALSGIRIPNSPCHIRITVKARQILVCTSESFENGTLPKSHSSPFLILLAMQLLTAAIGNASTKTAVHLGHHGICIAEADVRKCPPICENYRLDVAPRDRCSTSNVLCRRGPSFKDVVHMPGGILNRITTICWIDLVQANLKKLTKSN